MRVSTREIHRKVRELEPTVTDRELFASARFAAHLMDMAEVITGRFDKPIRIKVDWDESPDAHAGYINGDMIYINAANDISQSLPTRWLRYLSYIGIKGHEAGHWMITDFGMRDTYLAALYAGRFFPHRPEPDGFEDELHMSEIDDMFAENDKLKCAVFVEAAQALRNILEDYCVNSYMTQEYGGVIRYGLEVFLLRQASLMPAVRAQLDAGYAEYAVMLNTILQYAVFGAVNNLGGYTGKILDDFDAIAPIIDEAVAEDTRERLSSVNRLLVKLWPYIRAMIEDNKDEQKQSGVSDYEQAEIAKQKITKQVPGASDHSDSASNSGGAPPWGEMNDGEDLSDLKDSVMRSIEDPEQLRKFRKTDDFSESDGGTVSYDDEYGGTGYRYAADDIASLLSATANDKALEAFEEELTEELREEARRVRLGNAHKGVNLTIHRHTVIDESMVEQYREVAPPLELLAKKMLAIVAPYLRDEDAMDKVTGLFSGPYLDINRLHEPQRGIFYQRRTADEGFDVAVAVLNDISGSMNTADRITAAKSASLVVYDFCFKAGIPVTVYGHCAADDGVHLFSYAEFDAVDGNDRYRIMDMSPMGWNRDGAALRYVCEKLLKRPEHIKLLILASDGAPNDGDYCGSAAEADLRGIKREYTNKGITFVAAAIGDDRPTIERIYGKSFMDVGDLKKLPQNLVNVLMRCIH